MNRTMELVELLYWKPIPTKGSRGEIGEMKLAREIELATHRRKSKRSRRPSREKDPDIERESNKETPDGEHKVMEEDVQATSKRRKKFRWPAGMDLKARRAYGEALMSGHGVLHFVSLSPIMRTDCFHRP